MESPKTESAKTEKVGSAKSSKRNLNIDLSNPVLEQKEQEREAAKAAMQQVLSTTVNRSIDKQDRVKPQPDPFDKDVSKASILKKSGISLMRSIISTYFFLLLVGAEGLKSFHSKNDVI